MNSSIYEKELPATNAVSSYSIAGNTLPSIPVICEYNRETGKAVAKIDKSRLSKYGRELLEQLYATFGDPVFAINYAALHKIT